MDPLFKFILVGSQIVVVIAQSLQFVSKKETKLSASKIIITDMMKTTPSVTEILFYCQAPTMAMDSSL